MQTRPYGTQGLDVSAIAYGAMHIAADPDINRGVAPSLLHALDRGVTLIDTARAYPQSEALIASTLREWRGPRPAIATKLIPLSRETFRFPAPLSAAYSPASIRASVEASLRTLGVDTLDVVHLHQWWYSWTHDSEWFDTLVDLRREGKLRRIAISAQDHEHDALLEVVSLGLVDGIQIILNLFESRPMASLLPLAREKGVGVIARCVFDSGGLSGTLSKAEFDSRPFLKNAPYELYQERVRRLRERFIPGVAGDVADLALRFALSIPEVSSVTVGMHTRALVDATLNSAGKGVLPADAVGAIRREHVWTKNFYEGLT